MERSDCNLVHTIDENKSTEKKKEKKKLPKIFFSFTTKHSQSKTPIFTSFRVGYSFCMPFFKPGAYKDPA